MVGTGLRVDECLKLHWEDVIFMDRMKNNKNISGEINLDDNSRYWLKIYVRQSKTKQRECVSVSSSYFSLQRLMKLYKETGLQKISGEIWGVKSFREGLNELLRESKLKTENRGGTILKRDSKSFRNTFIQFMLDKGLNSTAIAKNCGTSTTMIDKHYTANSALESILDSWLDTGRTKLKRVS
jgi:integrase